MFLHSFLSYFQADPLRVLYFLGGAGGIWFWIEKWTNRTRVITRIVDQTFDLAGNGETRVNLNFEAVNLGTAATSLMPSITCAGFTPERKEMTGILQIRDKERMLPPHSTKTFRAVGEIDGTYPWWLYKRYTFDVARGWGQTIRLAYDGRRPIGWLKYSWRVTLFLRLGILPDPRPRGFGE